MSYGAASALQTAIFGALSADAVLAGLVGSAVFDAAPAGTMPELYVALGPEDVSARQDSAGSVSLHRLIISVVGTGAGFAGLKSAAGAVSDCLDQANLPLSRGTLVGLSFEKARARRSSDNSERRIDLWFRATVQDN